MYLCFCITSFSSSANYKQISYFRKETLSLGASNVAAVYNRFVFFKNNLSGQVVGGSRPTQWRFRIDP